eukprot:2076657-Rhodomonas_salina.1
MRGGLLAGVVLLQTLLPASSGRHDAIRCSSMQAVPSLLPQSREGTATVGSDWWCQQACRADSGDECSEGSARGRSWPARLYLRGGGRKGRPKATPEERATVDAILPALTPEQEKDLRRHWKKKPEWITVKQGGVEKKVKSKSIINVWKDHALEAKKDMKSWPLRLIDLGLKGLHWLRETPELQKALAAEPAPTKRWRRCCGGRTATRSRATCGRSSWKPPPSLPPPRRT